MSRQEHFPDPHEVFEARLEKFKFAIKKYKNDQLKVINDKADTEEEYEVGRIKKDANNKNEDSFRKMENNIKVAEKIFKSRKINQCRMSQMKIRFDMIERVQEETKNKLKLQKADLKGYKILLKDLIKQGLIKLIEENVQVRCLKEDQAIVRELVSSCERQFNEDCEVKAKITISTANYLTQADIGGVILTSLKGRIVCDNTLRARLSYCIQLLLPNIRSLLFDESDKFFAEKRKQNKPAEKVHAIHG